jgi:hypothetical protein
VVRDLGQCTAWAIASKIDSAAVSKVCFRACIVEASMTEGDRGQDWCSSDSNVYDMMVTVLAHMLKHYSKLIGKTQTPETSEL